MDQNILAYLAGFFDGEGCIEFGTRKTDSKVIISVGQTNPEPLLLFQKYFGHKVIKWSRLTKGGLQYWRYRFSKSEKVVTFLSSLYPYLIVKKDKAKLALELLDFKVNEDNKEFLLIPYMAGIFDAEGSISVRKREGHKLQLLITLTQTVINPLLLFKEKFGGYLCERKQRTKKGSPIFNYRLNISKVLEFCELLKPYIITKRSHMELAIRFQEIRLSNNGKDKRFEEKLDIAKQIIDLNSLKGHKEESKVLQLYN